MATDPAGPTQPSHDEPAATLRVRGAVGPVVAGFVGVFLSLLVLAIAGVASEPGVAAHVAAVLTPLVLVALAWPSTLRVGNDGVWFGKPWRRTFVPARDIRSAHQRWTGPKGASKARSVPEILLLRRGGRSPIVLPMVGPSPERVVALTEKIRRVAADAASTRASTLGVLDRGGRSIEAWRSDLGEVLRPGGFRTAGIDEDDLRKVLDDPNTRTEQRIGAALALASAPIGAGDRIRFVASASARPRLRIALEKVAEGSQRDAVAEIEAALAEDDDANREEATADQDPR